MGAGRSGARPTMTAPCSPTRPPRLHRSDPARSPRADADDGDEARRHGPRDPRRRAGPGRRGACANSPSASTDVDLDDCGSPPTSSRRAATRSRPTCATALEVAAGAHPRVPRGSSSTAPEPTLERDGVSRPRARACRSIGPGCYVPGGRAAYPSTVLMTAIPAQVAGVASSCSACRPTPTAASRRRRWPPPRSPGSTRCTAVGGAQAIAALAYGTETIRPVDVIVGPGQRLRRAGQARGRRGRVGIESFAGPVGGRRGRRRHRARRVRRRRPRSRRPSTAPAARPCSSTWDEAVADAVDRRARPPRGRRAAARRDRGDPRLGRPGRAGRRCRTPRSTSSTRSRPSTSSC